jgi:hypothetical protein
MEANTMVLGILLSARLILSISFGNRVIKADSTFMTAPQLSVDTVSESYSTDSITENGTPVNSNSMQQGVKYSLSDADAEYMSAVEKGDTETAQMMVDKVAREPSP